VTVPSRIHIARYSQTYEIALGRSRRRPIARFASPYEVQAVLRGLRFLDRKRASLSQMAGHLRAGESWARHRRSRDGAQAPRLPSCAACA
jgi:hypothetical protein